MFNPKVSIIISAYNHEKYVEQCVNSVFNQSYKNLEIFCMDNESKDKTYEIIKNLKNKFSSMIIDNIPYIYPYCWDEVRNASFKLMTGDYFLIISADDYLEKDFIKNNIEIFSKAPEKILILQSYLKCIYDNKEIGEIRHYYKNIEEMKNLLVKYSAVNCPCVMYNRKIYDDGHFDVDPLEFSGAGDYELWCRLAHKGIMVYPVPAWLGYYYRRHENQASWSMMKSEVNYDDIIKNKWKEKWNKL